MKIHCAIQIMCHLDDLTCTEIDLIRVSGQVTFSFPLKPLNHQVPLWLRFAVKGYHGMWKHQRMA